MARAVVLGGGGPVGIAWESGVAAGLADAGFDLAEADRIVGTSAGAIVGARLCSGRGARELMVDLDRLGDPHAEGSAPPKAADLGPLMQFMMRRPPNGFPSAALLAEMGAFAAAADTPSEEDFLAGIGRYVTGPSWPDRFVCTAVDVETGAFRVWNEASNVDLVRAVASSCAVPGLYPPVTIAGRRYMDGGLRSATNIDLAMGYDAVLAMAVTLEPFAGFMAEAADRELRPLVEAGARGLLVVPDSASLAAFGPNLMDGGRRTPVMRAGLAQGGAEANRLRGFWG